MLDEITKSTTALPQEEKDASIETQDLTCYWDKVRSPSGRTAHCFYELNETAMLKVCVVPRAESGCSISAEHLIHSQLKPAVGSDRTSGSWKGRFASCGLSYVIIRSSPSYLPLSCSTCVYLQSSLLSSILGELPSEKGVLKVRGQLTYAAQQPWVYPGTIRSNILFGKELNLQKYERVIRACALKRVRDG